METFGWAIKQMQNGERVSRAGWNGKGMWLVLVPATPNCALRKGTPYHTALNRASPGEDPAAIESVTINAHIDMFTVTGEMQPGWLASQTDMLATDGGVVE